MATTLRKLNGPSGMPAAWALLVGRQTLRVLRDWAYGPAPHETAADLSLKDPRAERPSTLRLGFRFLPQALLYLRDPVMAMGVGTSPEHDEPLERQLAIQWPAQFETPESPVIEGREVVTPDLERREGE